ncbi:MAG: class I SAM-dependent methyltransferase, partial [Pseudomonadota bacterium]
MNSHTVADSDTDRSARVAALANSIAYDRENAKRYISGAPHIKHDSLRQLYGTLLVRVLDKAQQHTDEVRVLDLGAGEGTVTLPFLELGASVTAVDLSEAQLDSLKTRCADYSDRLTVVCDDVAAVLDRLPAHFDVIVVNSFLHHIPDYLGLIDKAITLMTPHGQFFSF